MANAAGAPHAFDMADGSMLQLGPKGASASLEALALYSQQLKDETQKQVFATMQNYTSTRKALRAEWSGVERQAQGP
jgi:hypothetical protein